jgi:hypothetical protein
MLTKEGWNKLGGRVEQNLEGRNGGCSTLIQETQQNKGFLAFRCVTFLYQLLVWVLNQLERSEAKL